MLTQERFEAIVKVVNRAGAVTVQNLAKALNTSESTIRRDLVQLDSLGRVRKVHGGATSVVQLEAVQERCMQEKYNSNMEAKKQIAAYAASLVHEYMRMILFFLMLVQQRSRWPIFWKKQVLFM